MRVAIVLLAGCQSPAAPFDPFLAGRNTIPPPGTAVPAGSTPYYNAAPPAVTVPAPGGVYTAPGAIPAAAPVISTPAAGAGQLPRGISVPQSKTQTPGDGAQLAVWESSGDTTTQTAGANATPQAKPSDNKNSARDSAVAAAGGSGDGDRVLGSTSGVVRASYDERSREAPIRIIEPPAIRKAAEMADAKPPIGAPSQPSKANPPAAKTQKAPPRNLPELTDFPPAADPAGRQTR